MDGKPLHRFYPHHHHHDCHHPPNTVSFLFTPLWSTSPSPSECGSLFFWEGCGWGKRCIDVTVCTFEEEEREGSINPTSLSYSSSLFPSLIRVSESVGVSIQYPDISTVCSAPYDCKLRVNFHCWLRLGLQTSTVRPPILALRLSRQRLLPT